MKESSLDWKAWEKHIRDVFPTSDAVTQKDLKFFWEYDRPVLSILGHKYFVQYSKQIKDSTFFLNPSDHYPCLRLTEEISLNKAEWMRDNHFPFIDTKGNAFIRLPQLYLFVMGRKKQTQTALTWSKPRQGKLFKKSGVKLIYSLLSDPKLDIKTGECRLNIPIRELSNQTDLSIGTLSELITELKERGFLLEDQRCRHLINRKVLFEQWMHAYIDYHFKRNRQLYESSSIRWWQEHNAIKESFLWGGEPAASRLTDGYLLPEKLTIYTNNPLPDIVVQENLKPAEASWNVKFVPMLVPSETGSKGCVHPLLVYADLLYSNDDRNAETASRIYEQYLQHIIEPD